MEEGKGLYDKYTVLKNSGATSPDAQYFVLRIDTDPNARKAARYYADLVRMTNPELADQLIEQLKFCEAAASKGGQGVFTIVGLDSDG